MEPEGSLPCSQQPASDPYPEPDASNQHFLTLTSILILFSHLRLCFPKWSLSFRFSKQNTVRISHIPVHVTCPVHPILLDLITLTTLGEVEKKRSSRARKVADLHGAWCN
jgi:hypothetical protein